MQIWSQSGSTDTEQIKNYRLYFEWLKAIERDQTFACTICSECEFPKIYAITDIISRTHNTVKTKLSKTSHNEKWVI